jgi:hypothetical protein
VKASPCGKGVPRKESQVTEPSQLAVSQLTKSGTQRTEPRQPDVNQLITGSGTQRTEPDVNQLVTEWYTEDRT